MFLGLVCRYFQALLRTAVIEGIVAFQAWLPRECPVQKRLAVEEGAQHYCLKDPGEVPVDEGCIFYRLGEALWMTVMHEGIQASYGRWRGAPQRPTMENRSTDSMDCLTRNCLSWHVPPVEGGGAASLSWPLSTWTVLGKTIYERRSHSVPNLTPQELSSLGEASQVRWGQNIIGIAPQGLSSQA